MTDGDLAREAARPEVWYAQAGERHWVPDGPTVDSLGGWGHVQVVTDTIDNPIGDNWPSAIDGVAHYPDGNLVTAPPAPEIYVMEGGSRRWIPDPATFTARGYDWAAVRHLSTAEITALPLGTPLPSAAPVLSNVVSFDSGDTALGSGHFMRTWGTLTRDTGRCAAATRTRSVTWFGGYHGATYVILTDANDTPVPGGAGPFERYGVDGTMIGQSDRTDAWQFTIAPAPAALVRQAHIFLTWAPDDFEKVLGKWIADVKSVSDLATEVAGFAKIISSVLT